VILPKWDRRIQRAEELETTYTFASEVLRFYKRLAGFQKAVYSRFEAASTKRPAEKLSGVFRHDLNLTVLLPIFPKFLSDIEAIAPQPIAQSARDLGSQQAGKWQNVLTSTWAASDFQPAPDKPEALLAWLFLQPYAEYLADYGEKAPSNGMHAVCPRCSGKPQVGVLRQEGDGAKRSLICSLCSTEWAYGRIVCPACDEEDVDRLAIYTAAQFNHVRVEGCDSCGHYIKTVDLTRNGLAMPVVDELATIPLNLWAQEHGYTKLQTNLLGI
jgi:FdhE protein